LADFLGADAAGCVFVDNATAGMSVVLTSLAPSFEAGDEVLTTDHRYHAVTVQLELLCAQYGVMPISAHVPLDAAAADDVVAAIVDRITPRTRLVVVDAIASPSGFVFPVREMVAAAHQRGLPVLVDAAHAPGQVANDLTAVDADFWVGNLHKWICSPRAAAILAVAPKWRDVLRPPVASHRYADGFQPAFDWTGTFDPVKILAVPAALDFWERLGWDDVRSQQQRLVDDGAARVAAALGTAAPVRDEFRAAMRVIELPREIDPTRARDIEATLSEQHKIEVPLTDLHGKAWVRICAQVYNTANDYERLAIALPAVLGQIAA
jgi:isopenicillin-N epimerase